MDLAGKTVILTGVRRIGKVVALSLAHMGVNLVFSYLNDSDDLNLLCKECESLGSKAVAIKCDLSKESEVDNLVDQAIEKFGRVDILIHMAANYPKTPLAKISDESFNKNMDIIALSSLLLAKKLQSVMENNQGDIKGKMIFFSDWSVLRNPYPDYSVYNGAKAAVEAIAKTLAKEFAPSITVNVVAPGPILKPDGLAESEDVETMKNTPLKRWGGSIEIAKVVEYLLSADFVTGVVLPVDGGRSIA